jgi:hypothetical protein
MLNETYFGITETGRGGMGRTKLAQDRDLWKALTNTVVNLQIP